MLRQAVAALPRTLRAAAPRASAASQLLARPQAYAVATPALRSFLPATSRWYSDAKEAKSEENSETKEEEKGASDEVSELKKSLEAKDAEARDWKDKCMRTVADFRNLQDRTQREVKTARDFAIQKFAKDLVDSVDNLDRALANVPADKINASEKNDDLKELVNLYEGLKMTERILIQTLAKHGLERLEPEGEKFNPNEHEATFMTPQPEKENNTVFFVQQKGFKLNGRVLRAAKVGVVKNA
ncbi:mitochondrial co-chaperone GrpE [Cordyceps militaris CM01]|uniref:GrpE protein homolog n=2 Tax=Cordyceps militaris TaxID=73501 RepID=G3J6H4_CORMM|nr:mitochondrial co-chaperone GrpE [Cordyceps militaris CM01]ATY63308.1 mitochondrial co-chaperone [Cordyceps militaris]EGX96208.1 mitochondrial co-chaperone GrpE [Cordyceps militaris CM01]